MLSVLAEDPSDMCNGDDGGGESGISIGVDLVLLKA